MLLQGGSKFLFFLFIHVWLFCWVKVNSICLFYTYVFILFLFGWSWRSPSQMVWSWGWIQCHGHWPSWTKPWGLVQLLQSEIFIENSFNARRSTSKQADISNIVVFCLCSFYTYTFSSVLCRLIELNICTQGVFFTVI